jgi:hypothetical protein
MQWLFMRRDQALCWAYMPQVLQRVTSFLDRYDTDTPKHELWEQVSRMFAAGDRRLGLWIIADPNFNVVAHMLAQPEPVDKFDGPWSYVLIRQTEVDPRIDVRAESREVFAAVQQWTKSLGVNRMLMLTHRDSAAMARRWGWSEYKTLMEKDI